MLRARQDQRIVQDITVMILRTREQQKGTGIFYHTDLRRTVLVPDRDEDWDNPKFMGQAGLSSHIGGQFSEVPEGFHQEHLYGIVGTCVETPKIQVPLVEGGEIVTIDPTDLVVQMEILKPDLQFLQEQNQMALLLHCKAFVQLNTQDYGEGFTEDGRDRSILRGSLWAVPERYIIDVSRPELKTAAGSREEVLEAVETARAKNTQRALSARAQSWANRAERDERRAKDDMPARRGTNTHVQTYDGGHLGVQNRTL